MRRTYLYKAVINKSTEANCIRWLDLCRCLYNAALEQRIDAYSRCGVSLSGYDQAMELPALKQVFPEFKAVGSQCLQDVIERLDKAFKAFFRRLKTSEDPGFPRFKGRNRYDSFTLKQAGWTLDGRYLHIRNIGRFKLFLSRPIEGNIKTITIRRAPGNRWLIAFSCNNVPVREFPDTDREVGIDVGIKSFCVDSDGNSIANPAYFRVSERLLRRRQRSLARKQRGSNRRSKARVLVGRAHEKIANQRRDFLHKTANHYIENYKTIHIESLNIRGMVRNRHLSKSISDSSWGKFFNILSGKAEEAGRMIVKVPPHGTSQSCSGCGEKVPKSLSVRVHKCPHCGLVLDRDLNASINILRLGQSLQASTWSDGTCVA